MLLLMQSVTILICSACVCMWNGINGIVQLGLVPTPPDFQNDHFTELTKESLGQIWRPYIHFPVSYGHFKK